MKMIPALTMILTILLSCGMTNAQEIEITYKESIKSEQTLSQIDDPQIAALVESKLRGMDKTMFLRYSDGKSLYSSAGFTNASENLAVFKDFKNHQMVSQENILDRTFLIEEPLARPEWTLGKETLEILNYNCQKATNANGAVVWYSSEIPINDGPATFYGLPGIILKIETKTKIIEASSITTEGVENSSIKKPTKGTKISRDKFIETRDKKLKEMGVDGTEGESGVKIIKM